MSQQTTDHFVDANKMVYSSNGLTLYRGDCLGVMAELPAGFAQCCVTSPPYFALRSYLPADHPDKHLEIGREATPDEFVANMRAVFGGKESPAGVWRALRDDGVLWLNLGDSYARNGGTQGGGNRELLHMEGKQTRMGKIPDGSNLKPKDLIGIPWRVALALQADGWTLRDAVIWHKPSPMPGSQRDRCTSAYEFVFQLTKRPRYFFDLEAIKEPSSGSHRGSSFTTGKTGAVHSRVGQGPRVERLNSAPRNVWKIASEGFSAAHFATFPVALAAKCIKAATSEKGCCPECGAPWKRLIESDRQPTRPGNANVSDDTGMANRDEQRHVTNTTTVGWQRTCKCGVEHGEPEYSPIPCTVFDPFGGAATTLLAAKQLGRHGVAIELSADYCEIAKRRLRKPLTPPKAKQPVSAAGQGELF